MPRQFHKISFVLLLSVITSAAATAPRTIAEYPEAREYLRRTTNLPFYKSVLNAPVNHWITVRGDVAGDHLQGTHLVRSDAEPVFNDLALELAQNLQVIGANVSRQRTNRAALVHLLIYKIADGDLAVSFAHFDEPGAAHLRIQGAAWMAVRKQSGQWVTIEPRWHLGREHRGPRTYGFFAQEPGVPQRYRGTGIPMNPGQMHRPGAE